MLSKVYSNAVLGIETMPIEIEVDVNRGLSKVAIVGLPDEAVKEAKDRVKSALVNSGFEFPAGRLTINLAPATIKKIGPDFDLAFAVGILNASGQLNVKRGGEYIILGELALDGRVRRVKGVLPRVLDAKKGGVKGVILPAGNAKEAAIVNGISIFPVSDLMQVLDLLQDKADIQSWSMDLEKVFSDEMEYIIDFSDVKGQHAVKRSLEVAAAGAHNMLMIGPPGVGKTMLAKRLPTIIPNMTIDESIETTMLYSVTGSIKKGQTLIAQRPFRAPHYTISDVGLVGGGSFPSPGEISLAHNGVLFLDELPEFKRNVLEVLRQPLEDGEVTVSRAKGSFTFPARFMMIAAMNPCPCGYFTHPKKECRCTPGQRQRYMSKISGPLLDRIDIHIEVMPVEYKTMREDVDSENSASIRKRVSKAREMQRERFKRRKKNNGDNSIYKYNGYMSNKEIKEFCGIDSKSEKLLEMAVDDLKLSARAHNKILKVARTIADLEEQEDIKTQHISEAIQYRVLDRNLAF